ncbi:hypothetical protein GGX14DRAFT_617872 [Mycena pura]|uniref:Uncharacterized protein n=1 Tax=Mycena pura TaxID=153505 RepID=A0AAD6VMG4_9AGAR|nr:hypothetical protein GGX14DRAFT_617872 [Mycena pura]
MSEACVGDIHPLSCAMMQIQELVDLTVDFLHDSVADLKRCSLVSRSWVPSARFHLFSYFAFGDELECQRLVVMLEEAPHLLKLMTHLAIAFHPRLDTLAYGVLSKIPFAHLKRLTIYTLPWKAPMLVLQNLVALPNITHIVVMQTRDPKLLFSLFLHRTASLETLEIRSREYATQREDVEDVQIQAHAQRLQIDRLRVANMPTARLHDPSLSPFDLSALKRLVVTEYQELCSFRGILTTLGPSLSHLEIAGLMMGHPGSEGFGKGLDIGPKILPRLMHFTFHVGTPSMLSGIPVLLSGIPPNTLLQQITLVVDRDCAPSCTDVTRFELVDAWNAIDAAVGCFHSISLTVRVTLTVAGALESVLGVSELRACLPRLAKTKRLLVVEAP